jgi:hypothetical protein
VRGKRRKIEIEADPSWVEAPSEDGFVSAVNSREDSYPILRERV